jgi:hypothetical protein
MQYIKNVSINSNSDHPPPPLPRHLLGIRIFVVPLHGVHTKSPPFGQNISFYVVQMLPQDNSNHVMDLQITIKCLVTLETHVVAKCWKHDRGREVIYIKLINIFSTVFYILNFRDCIYNPHQYSCSCHK